MVINSILNNIQPLDQSKIQKFEELESLYTFWNAQINVISRKDMDQFYLHHVLHSLTLTKFVHFTKGSKIMDLGCGGGFPGIPLAIFFPEVEFVLIDSIGKKIKVVKEISESLQLKNIRAYHIRAEEYKEKFHFVVTRAVSKLSDLIYWTRFSFDGLEINAIPNGIIAYKGGDLQDELSEIRSSNPHEIWDISKEFPEEYFKNKYLVYVQK